MNRRHADGIVAVLVGAVVVVGGALAWQAYRQQQALGSMDGMMGDSMGTMHGTNPLWYVLGTLLLAGVVGGLYLVVRDDLDATTTATGATTTTATPTETPTETPATDDTDETDDIDDSGSPAKAGSLAATTEPASGAADDVDAGTQSRPRQRVLELLPDDERRILEPVVASPGITQIALRDRADFSKSKVSQTVSDLEKRGLLYRERQGRTYRVYPSDDLRQQDA